MRHTWFWVGLLWPAAMFAASFDHGPDQGLAQLVQEALDQNPEIQAARQRWESAQAVIPQVQTLPDPKVNFVYWGLEQQAMYGMSQEIPFPGKLGLKGEIASRESERVEQEYLATRLAVVARLKEAFYELHMVHKSIDVISKNKHLLEDFEETAAARYAVGQAAQQDVLRAQTEISRLLARLASLEQRRQSSHAEINRLLNRLPSDPLGAPEEIRFTPMRRSLPHLNALVEQGSPLLQGRQKNLERDSQAIALAEKECMPDFDVTALGVRDTRLARDSFQVMLSIKVPLYQATKYSVS